MSHVRKYLRFYYPEFQRDYPDIYADDATFAAWMRLLVLSEQTWPANPELPRSVRPKALAILRDRGLVIVTGTAYQLKGFVAERTARSSAAAYAAAVRWQSGGNADAMPSTSTSTRTKAKQGVSGENGARPALRPVQPGETA